MIRPTLVCLLFSVILIGCGERKQNPPDIICDNGPWHFETIQRPDDRPHSQGGRGGMVKYYIVICD